MLGNGWEECRPEGGDVSEQLWGAGAGDQPVGIGVTADPCATQIPNKQGIICSGSTHS